jgi:transmembrane sensor
LAGERFLRTAQLARTAQELLDLADVARLSGHPRDALVPLNRVLDDFAHSPHAAVAAFTLGRALLDQLYQPRDAALAFERAISMQPPRALLEDCYARLVQAYARVGAESEAARAAAKYRERFPNGRHTAELSRWLSE